ncbi:dual specificity protein phosphatase, putative [Entamoeba invadens IP1]|uniref:dual specificity protein phosphatase, putative n=1 Tax=Entamoeba invadens IP1 TaxID=370355 RepID=UPI0002C3D398|nr:dual specificity protein phosphatase, putative [Entamoeba invadens IP1]ELP90522.1 dual specificity protein phosphatase, putative [Entamoeba invadens IP1]|eukprot:XP_004257293.1 dual specificity protein phosphatase, putative [Entamoeba invadens IP1]
MASEEVTKRWNRCFGKNSFIVMLDAVDNVDNLVNYISTIKPMIQELVISSAQVDHIPNLEQLTLLSMLDFSFNKINDISILEKCKSLQTLILAQNEIKDIACLSSLHALSTLDVSNNLITEITTSPYLNRLKTSNTPLQKLTITSPLRSLFLDKVPMKELKLNIKTLEHLSISNCEFTYLDLDCEHLTELVADYSVIPPTSTLNLPHLQGLMMNHANADSVSALLSKISHLKNAVLQFGELKRFPEELLQIRSLELVQLSSNPFTEIPEQITRLTNLTHLDVVDCIIEKLPNMSTMELKNFSVGFEDDSCAKNYQPLLPKGCVIIGREWKKFDKIVDRLYLGSYANAHNKRFLLENKVTHILSVAPLKPVFPELFKYKCIDIDDSVLLDITPFINECISFIDEGRKCGGVLVHCAAGISRSASIVIAYLMKTFRWSYETALNHTVKCRPIICPNSSFVKQLKEYENTLPKESSTCTLV